MARTHRTLSKDLHDPGNHDGLITQLEPDILECEVKWALGSITTNKARGGDGIPVELFQILKDNALYICIWENGIETCILSCKKRITSLGSIQHTGCLGLVHWDDPERRYGERWEGGSALGTHVHPWRIHVNVWQKPIQYCKVKKINK